MRLVSLALIFVLLATASALAQDPSAKPATIAATVNKTWSGLERDFISAADAMPEEKYSFAPAQGEFNGARSFAEQVRHVACSNFAFFKNLAQTSGDLVIFPGRRSRVTGKPDRTQLGKVCRSGHTGTSPELELLMGTMWRWATARVHL